MGIAVAHIAGDLIILSGCVFQKKFRFFHPFSGQGFNKGFTRIIFKDRTEIAGAHGQMGADRIQGHICIFIMLLNIIQCPECLPFTVAVLLIPEILCQTGTESDQYFLYFRKMIACIDRIHQFSFFF